MRPIGFSTGALARSDFRRGVELIREHGIALVELSALREWELAPLVAALDDLDLGAFDHISFHAPSRIERENEPAVFDLLTAVAERAWPIVVHPDALRELHPWRDFGSLLCIENMDKRKPGGRTVRELHAIFEALPEAKLCLDLGHARQMDPTMSIAAEILEAFGERLCQLHVSEVSSNSQHEPLTLECVLAFQRIHALIPDHIPVVLESHVAPSRIAAEIHAVRQALPQRAAWVCGAGRA